MGILHEDVHAIFIICIDILYALNLLLVSAFQFSPCINTIDVHLLSIDVILPAVLWLWGGLSL
jgi:hypothetical protein